MMLVDLLNDYRISVYSPAFYCRFFQSISVYGSRSNRDYSGVH